MTKGGPALPVKAVNGPSFKQLGRLQADVPPVEMTNLLQNGYLGEEHQLIAKQFVISTGA
jgi:hypothetical protein